MKARKVTPANLHLKQQVGDTGSFLQPLNHEKKFYQAWVSDFHFSLSLSHAIKHPSQRTDALRRFPTFFTTTAQVLFEDNSVNRMQESLELFTEVAGNPIFEKTPIFVFLNKKDLFEEMIATKVRRGFNVTYGFLIRVGAPWRMVVSYQGIGGAVS